MTDGKDLLRAHVLGPRTLNQQADKATEDAVKETGKRVDSWQIMSVTEIAAGNSAVLEYCKQFDATIATQAAEIDDLKGAVKDEKALLSVANDTIAEKAAFIAGLEASITGLRNMQEIDQATIAAQKGEAKT